MCVFLVLDQVLVLGKADMVEYKKPVTTMDDITNILIRGTTVQLFIIFGTWTASVFAFCISDPIYSQ